MRWRRLVLGRLEQFHVRYSAAPAVVEVVSALGFGELVEDWAAEFPELIDGPCSAGT